jgi:Bacterial Ig-like domain (group 2)
MTAGPNQVTAAVVGVTPASLAAIGSAGSLSRIEIVTPNPATETGDMTQMSATGADAYGNPVHLAQPLTWTSADPAVATITPGGLLAALSPGPARISASDGVFAGSLTLTVNAGITFTLGAEETVFTYNTDQCDYLDIPDVPARAVRLADGTLVLVSGSGSRNYAMFGADFSSLKKDCSTPTLVSHDDPTPQSYQNLEWVDSVYRQGNAIHALIHNEYHDPFAPNCLPGDTTPANSCWYNSITYAVSTDSGHTYTQAATPAHILAPAPELWDPTGTPPPYGYFNPTNIVHAADNYYYSIFIGNRRSGQGGLCVMRTLDLSDPTTWHAWDGSGYNLAMTSPYAGPAPGICALIGVGQLLGPYDSLTFNTYLNKYMITGLTVVGDPQGNYVCGIGYSLSTDFIHWTRTRLIEPRFNPGFQPCASPNGAGAVAFVSVIDHADSSINFEKPGSTPYIYYTLFNDHFLNRDLVRVPVTIMMN